MVKTEVAPIAVENKKKAREEIGVVVSNKMTKTIVVKLDRRIRHAQYGKFLTKSKKIKAHDELNTAGIGDQVLVVESRPLSKEKRYALKKILRKATA
jgi:small subunit ribosomal protein S17